MSGILYRLGVRLSARTRFARPISNQSLFSGSQDSFHGRESQILGPLDSGSTTNLLNHDIQNIAILHFALQDFRNQIKSQANHIIELILTSCGVCSALIRIPSRKKRKVLTSLPSFWA